MALTFPLALTDFADLLNISNLRWSLNQSAEVSFGRDGRATTRDLGTRMWSAQVTVGDMNHRQAAKAEARAEAIGSTGLFYLTNPALPAPYSDLGGNSIGGENPALYDIATDKLSVRINSLPAGYVLTTGDLFSFTYQGGARHSLHRICEDSQADGSGVTGWIDVRPAIRLNATAPLSPQFVRPTAKMMFAPGSFQTGSIGSVITSGATFTAIEVL